MLIAWQALNKQSNPQDRRFSDKFLIVTPGITIRDRLRVLIPNDPGNYYRLLDILTPEQLDRLQAATVEITNFHTFLRREKIEAAGLTKTDPRRPRRRRAVPRDAARDGSPGLPRLRQLEEHRRHQRRGAPLLRAGAEGGTEGRRARRRRAEPGQEGPRGGARLASGLQAVRDKLGVRAVFDLSATPFFLKGSGYAEGTLFPWVVSDFGLMDAIESGIVKIPRVPVSDDSMTGTGPMYRDLWLRVRDALPRKGIKDTPIDGLPVIPKELEGALRSLYADYERSHADWDAAGMGTPPVFIVVCSNTATSKLVSDWIAGWEKELPDGSTSPGPGQPLTLHQRSTTAASSTARTRSWSTPPSSTVATPSTPRSARPPPLRSTSSSASTSSASRAARRTTSPTNRSCARS